MTQELEMRPPREQLEWVVEHVAILSDKAYEFAGKRQKAAEVPQGFVRASEGYPAIVREVGQAIYARFYARPGESRGPYVSIPDMGLKSDFARAVFENNKARSTWTPGWQILERGTQIRVRDRRGNERFVPAEETKELAGTVFVRDDMSSAYQGGWIHVRGELDHPYGPEPTFRFYWALTPIGALALAGTASLLMNKNQVPFRLKVTDDPQRFVRPDAGVLYVPAHSATEMRKILPQLYAQVHPYLRNPTPLMTRRLAPGLGFAISPGFDESFGMLMGRLIAEGLWDACKESLRKVTDRQSAVQARFYQAGIDVERPYLCTSMQDPDFSVTNGGTAPLITELA